MVNVQFPLAIDFHLEIIARISQAVGNSGGKSLRDLEGEEKNRATNNSLFCVLLGNFKFPLVEVIVWLQITSERQTNGRLCP